MKVNKKGSTIFCLTNRKYYASDEMQEEAVLFRELSDAVETLRTNIEPDCEVRYMGDSECTLENAGRCIEEYGSFSATAYYEKPENPLFENLTPREEMFIISKVEIF